MKGALAERGFRQLRICDRSEERARALAEALSDCRDRKSLSILVCDTEEMVSRSDVVITVTPSWEPIVKSEWVQSETHLACMDTDTAAKQEVEIALVARTSLFGDERREAVAIGECQQAFRDDLIEVESITPIGRVISGKHPVRQHADEITLFDSTGLQDLVVARLALARTVKAERAIELR